MKIVREYSYQEQIDDLVNATGLSKQAVKRFLQAQRQLAQDKLRLGESYNLKGIVKIEPKSRGNEIILSATVAQSVVRPIIIKTIGTESTLDDIENRTVEDDDLI